MRRLKTVSGKMRPYVVIFGDLCMLAAFARVAIAVMSHRMGAETMFQARNFGKIIARAWTCRFQFVNAAPVAEFFLAAIEQIQTIFWSGSARKGW